MSGSNQANPALLYNSERNSGIVAWSPDGRYIVSAGQENTAQIWEASTGKLLVNYTGHSAGVTAAAWSPDGKYIASASFPDGIANVWDARTGQRLLTFREQASTAGRENINLSVAWSPDGKKIASGGSDSTMQVWDPLTGKLYAKYTPPPSTNIPRRLMNIVLPEWFMSVAWSPDGKYLASATGVSVQIWKAP